MKILDQELTYQVDQIRIVEPTDTEAALISEGNDYCTLLTCTPYGINSHRLLVRGVRVPNIRSPLYISTEAFELDSLFLAPAVAAPMLLVWIIILIVRANKAKKQKEEEEQKQQNQDQNKDPDHADPDGGQNSADAADLKKKPDLAGGLKKSMESIRSKYTSIRKKDK